ncbi:MAG: hypothetical protein ACRYFW_16370 [Janthinobacterium lividum]
MADDVESHTIMLLQEMRAEITGRFDEMSERLDDLANRVDGNTLILNMLAGMVASHEDRLDSVEESRR